MSESESSLRIDKWLWAARFFKTRSLAADAVAGGKVHVDGQRIKPSRAIKPGDEVRIRKGPLEFTVHVRALSSRRGPASVACTLYEETPDSIAAREALAEQRKLAALASPSSGTKPDKRSRRRIIRFTRKQGD